MRSSNRRRFPVALLCVGFFFGASPSCWADPLKVTSGLAQLYPNGSEGDLSLFLSGPEVSLVVFGRSSALLPAYPPPPVGGEFAASYDVTEITGSIEDFLHPDVPLFIDDTITGGMSRLVFASPPAPITCPSVIEVCRTSAQFSFVGRLTAQGSDAKPRVYDLTGHGAAKASFCCPVGNIFSFDGIEYRFTPAALPEPGSLLLMSAAFLVIPSLRARRKSQWR